MHIVSATKGATSFAPLVNICFVRLRYDVRRYLFTKLSVTPTINLRIQLMTSQTTPGSLRMSKA